MTTVDVFRWDYTHIAYWNPKVLDEYGGIEGYIKAGPCNDQVGEYLGRFDINDDSISQMEKFKSKKDYPSKRTF